MPTVRSLRVTVLVTLLVLVAALIVGMQVLRPKPAEASIAGPAERTVLNATQVSDLQFQVTPGVGVDAERVTVTVDGRSVKTVREGKALVVRPAKLADGRHVLEVSVARSGFEKAGGSRRTFSVDSTAPELDLPPTMTAPSLRGAFQVKGSVVGASTVTVNGTAAKLSGKTFTAELAAPPTTVEVVATDTVGNIVRDEVAVSVRHPGMRAVHMTALAWTASSLREPILKLARQGRIDAIELDIKDEDGLVGYDSQVPLARRLHAAKGYYDARKVLDQLHAMHVRVVGRIVAFRDPKLGQWAWRNGHRDWVTQTRDGKAYGGHYGNYAFTNPFQAGVRQYNIDLATEAAKLGFDDILYDYVRRPDGKLSGFRFVGRTGTPEQAIVGFVKDSREAVRAEGAFLGASVYGIAATRPTEIAQDIPGMAQYADFIAPMVYPSHWGRGEYDVSNPNAQPYQIVKRSLADFARISKGTDSQIMPWLQDFSLGVKYGVQEVAAQIRAAHENGMDSFILWNATARYHGGALAIRR
jgi:LysM repeat protein